GAPPPAEAASRRLPGDLSPGRPPLPARLPMAQEAPVRSDASQPGAVPPGASAHRAGRRGPCPFGLLLVVPAGPRSRHPLVEDAAKALGAPLSQRRGGGSPRPLGDPGASGAASGRRDRRSFRVSPEDLREPRPPGPDDP